MNNNMKQTSCLVILGTTLAAVCCAAAVAADVGVASRGVRIDIKKAPDLNKFLPRAALVGSGGASSIMHVCVNETGAVIEGPSVATSSGVQAADAAALAWSKELKFLPAEQDGKKVGGCTEFKVTFRDANLPMYTPAPEQLKATPMVLKSAPDISEYFPKQAIERHEQGVVGVKVCVASSGKQGAKPKLVSSSGNKLLDDAAVKYTRQMRFESIELPKGVDALCGVHQVKFELLSGQ